MCLVSLFHYAALFSVFSPQHIDTPLYSNYTIYYKKGKVTKSDLSDLGDGGN